MIHPQRPTPLLRSKGGSGQSSAPFYLYGDRNDASVLLRDAPQSEYTVETKSTMDLGVDTDPSFQ